MAGPGTNAGRQLNLFLFEVGMIRRDPLGLLPDVVLPVAVHPLLVIPTSVRYTDASRGSVQETAQGSVRAISGRALRRVQMQGTFGVESRGLLLYVGTGELRFQRFWHEVVRLSEATTQDQVDAELDPLRSPLLQLAMKAYDEEYTTLFVNFYDFWHNVQMEIHPGTFSFEKIAGRGASQGQTHYTFDFEEAGQIVTGGIANTLVRGLFEGLTAWNQSNELLQSYTLQAVLDGFASAANLIVRQAQDLHVSLQAQINVQLPHVLGLLEGFTPRGQPATLTDQSVTALAEYLSTADELATLSEDLADSLAAATPSQPNTDPGQVNWAGTTGEGQNDALEAAEQVDALHNLAAAARFQKAAGSLYGMSREEFDEFLTSTGRSGRDSSLWGTVEYTITPYDTIERLEAQWGVSFDMILEVNQMLASEVLITGTKILIPRQRQVGSQTRIEGLPVFGSHAGQEAFGRDMYADMRVDSNGSLAILSGPPVLVQGVDWIIAQEGEDLLEFANRVPVLPAGDAQTEAVRKKVAVMLLTDRRFATVREITSTSGEGGTSIELDATLVAINGDTISTAGRAS